MLSSGPHHDPAVEDGVRAAPQDGLVHLTAHPVRRGMIEEAVRVSDLMSMQHGEPVGRHTGAFGGLPHRQVEARNARPGCNRMGLKRAIAADVHRAGADVKSRRRFALQPDMPDACVRGHADLGDGVGAVRACVQSHVILDHGQLRALVGDYEHARMHRRLGLGAHEKPVYGKPRSVVPPYPQDRAVLHVSSIDRCERVIPERGKRRQVSFHGLPIYIQCAAKIDHGQGTGRNRRRQGGCIGAVDEDEPMGRLRELKRLHAGERRGRRRRGCTERQPVQRSEVGETPILIAPAG